MSKCVIFILVFSATVKGLTLVIPWSKSQIKPEDIAFDAESLLKTSSEPLEMQLVPCTDNLGRFTNKSKCWFQYKPYKRGGGAALMDLLDFVVKPKSRPMLVGSGSSVLVPRKDVKSLLKDEDFTNNNIDFY